jgi:hypothetical protein
MARLLVSKPPSRNRRLIPSYVTKTFLTAFFFLFIRTRSFEFLHIFSLVIAALKVDPKRK